MELLSMGKPHLLRRLLTLVVTLPALLFIVMGLRWLINPAGISPDLGLSLQTGLGLSAQIGDFSAFFLVAGLCILYGLVTSQPIWYYPPAMLLTLAAIGRTVAWILHGADFATSAILFEITVASLLLFASKNLTQPRPE